MNEEMRIWFIEHENEIPRRLLSLAWRAPTVTWLEAIKLYQLTVEEAKIFFNVEHIIDAPFGRARVWVNTHFTDKILATHAKRVRDSINGTHD